MTSTIAFALLWESLCKGQLRYLGASSQAWVVEAQFERVEVPIKAGEAPEIDMATRHASGEALKLIALDLGVSPSIVATRVQRVLARMGFVRRGALSLVPIVAATAYKLTLPDPSAEFMWSPTGISVRVSTANFISRAGVEAQGHVVLGLCCGLTIAEIAAARGCSQRTAANLVANAIGKCKARGRAELMTLLATSIVRA